MQAELDRLHGQLQRLKQRWFNDGGQAQTAMRSPSQASEAPRPRSGSPSSPQPQHVPSSMRRHPPVRARASRMPSGCGSDTALQPQPTGAAWNKRPVTTPASSSMDVECGTPGAAWRARERAASVHDGSLPERYTRLRALPPVASRAARSRSCESAQVHCLGTKQCVASTDAFAGGALRGSDPQSRKHVAVDRGCSADAAFSAAEHHGDAGRAEVCWAETRADAVSVRSYAAACEQNERLLGTLAAMRVEMERLQRPGSARADTEAQRAASSWEKGAPVSSEVPAAECLTRAQMEATGGAGGAEPLRGHSDIRTVSPVDTDVDWSMRHALQGVAEPSSPSGAQASAQADALASGGAQTVADAVACTLESRALDTLPDAASAQVAALQRTVAQLRAERAALVAAAADAHERATAATSAAAAGDRLFEVADSSVEQLQHAQADRCAVAAADLVQTHDRNSCDRTGGDSGAAVTAVALREELAEREARIEELRHENERLMELSSSQRTHLTDLAAALPPAYVAAALGGASNDLYGSGGAAAAFAGAVEWGRSAVGGGNRGVQALAWHAAHETGKAGMLVSAGHGRDAGAQNADPNAIAAYSPHVAALPAPAGPASAEAQDVHCSHETRMKGTDGSGPEQSSAGARPNAARPAPPTARGSGANICALPTTLQHNSARATDSQRRRLAALSRRRESDVAPEAGSRKAAGSHAVQSAIRARNWNVRADQVPNSSGSEAAKELATQ